MPPGPLAPEVVIWTDALHAGLVASLLDVMGSDVRPIGVGGPRVAEVDALAKRLDCPREDDLRKLVVDRPAAFLLLASMADAALSDLHAAGTQGSLVLALEPVAAELPDLAALARPSAAGKGEPIRPPRVIFAPAFRQAPGYLQSAEPHDVLGEQRLVAIEHCGPQQSGTLFARLFDAWQTVLGFTSLPLSIDASLASPAGDVTDDLRRVGGRMAAHARVPDGSSVVLFASDQAAEARRWLHVLGDLAELRVSDVSYDLRSLDGASIDRATPSAGASPVDLIARQWRRLLDRPDLAGSDHPPHRDTEALACCLACLLSARTGQPESPRKLIEMTR